MKTLNGADDWWGNVFSEAEISELKSSWDDVLSEHEAMQQLLDSVSIVHLTVEFPLENFERIFAAIHEAYPEFPELFALGEALAKEYMVNAAIEADETLTDYSMSFADEWFTDEDDDEEEYE